VTEARSPNRPLFLTRTAVLDFSCHRTLQGKPGRQPLSFDGVPPSARTTPNAFLRD
jgi:hypothetical protein